MTCNLSQIRKQLDDMQMIVDAHVEFHKNDKPELLDKYPKEAIEMAIRETKNALIDAIVPLGRDLEDNDQYSDGYLQCRMDALMAIYDVK